MSKNLIKEPEMLKEISWDDFRTSGFFWLVNRFLHMFGMAIVAEKDAKGFIKRVYPARCRYRGFAEDSNERGYINIANYLNKNAAELYKESIGEFDEDFI
jgi:hypothetical protein